MLNQLNHLLSDNFDQVEIDTISFSMDISPEEFGSKEFIGYFDRRGTLPDLVTTCQKARPDLDWGVLPAWVQIYSQFQHELTDEEILKIGELLNLSPLSAYNLSQAFFEKAQAVALEELVGICQVVRPDLDWGNAVALEMIHPEEDWELEGCSPEDESEPEMASPEENQSEWYFGGQTRSASKNSGLSPAESPAPITSNLRLDVAVPVAVKTKRPFVLAVAIRQAASPILSEKHLEQVDSDDFEVEWHDQDTLDLTVEINAPDCQITSDSKSPILLRREHDSPVLHFHLIPETEGPISIIVTVFHGRYPLGSTWLESVATAKPLVQVETTVQSQPLVEQSRMVKLFDQIYSTFIVDELKTVAFRLNIDYEEFVRESKSGTIRELILLCQRRKLVDKLLETCRLFRPQFEWRLS